ncbi:MAG: hypothetical protein Q8896_13780, partial [Bacteroidota bacterium]|nr:hypothetical protein [Bacteroidota bacterium]
MKRYLFPILPLLVLVGCLSDTIDGPQVVPRPILQPGAVYFKCITNTTNLLVTWNPSPVDTQQNFKGYFLLLYQSAPYSTPGSNLIDSPFYPPIDTAHVSKSDTMYTFINNPKIVQGGRYTVMIWGERYPDPANKDSLVLSQFPASLSFNYDSRPVFAPSELYASSGGPTLVNLFYSRSVSDKNLGMIGYIVRYIDTTNRNAHLTYLATFPKDTFSAGLLLGKYKQQFVSAPGDVSPPVEKSYKFWVKAIRQDSVESDDSIGIVWSGAEIVPPSPLGVKLDTGVFMGPFGFGYNLVQTDLSNGWQLKLSKSGTEIVVSSNSNANSLTRFSTHIDHDTNLSFNREFYSAPFPVSDFTESQVSFPAAGAAGEGTMIYAYFPGTG